MPYVVLCKKSASNLYKEPPIEKKYIEDCNHCSVILNQVQFWIRHDTFYEGSFQMVLGIFPKEFSQGRLPKWQFSYCAISLLYNFPRVRFIRLLGRCRLHSWEVSIWENTIGNLSFGKKALGKLPDILFLQITTTDPSKALIKNVL